MSNALKSYRRTLAWGGSMAIRRTDFYGFGLHGLWQHALSDDYVLSHQIRNVHKKIIRFSHASFLPSVADFNWKSFFEFAPRQYKITKVCAPTLWFITLTGCILYFLAFAARHHEADQSLARLCQLRRDGRER